MRIGGGARGSNLCCNGSLACPGPKGRRGPRRSISVPEGGTGSEFADLGPNRSTSPRSGRICAEIGRHWADWTSGHIRLNLAKCGAGLVPIPANISKIGPESTDVGPMTAEFGPCSTDVGQIWPESTKFGRNSTELGSLLAEFDRMGRILAGFDLVGPESADFGRSLTRCGPESIGQDSARAWPRLGQHRSTWILTSAACPLEGGTGSTPEHVLHNVAYHVCVARRAGKAGEGLPKTVDHDQNEASNASLLTVAASPVEGAGR